MILYFSGTGNSKYVAKRIADALGDALVNLNDRIKSGDTSSVETGERVIIVTPTYAWRIPRVVRDWLLKTELRGAKQVWFVMTCGSEIGNADKYNRELCAEKAISCMGTAQIVMPENYIAMFSAPILQVFLFVLTPLNFLFSLWKKLLAKVFRLNGESKMSQEELLMLVDEVQQGGSIDKSEGELLRNAIEFSEQQAKDILIHRVDLAALPVTASREETAALFTNTKYSRLLVYQDSIDHILGTIHRKDFYVGCGVTGKPIAELLSPTIFAPENEPISLLLKKMQQGKTHVAVVVDEYGGTCGIVTMEDILEELVGEIWDEHEQEEIPIRETAEHTYLVDAGMDFDDFADFFHLKTDSEMVSVSGWVMERCGGVPESGDRFTYDDLDVLVVKVDHHRIEELRVTQRPHAGEKAETALIGEMIHE
jgi:CBS domain containing-hemolysin-like protein